MPVVAPLRVEVGKPDPLYGGLLNVGKSLGFLHDVSDPHIGMGADWEAAVCGPSAFAPGVCDDAMAVDPETPKDFEVVPRNEAQPFAVYNGIQCDLFRDDYQALATEALERGETIAVEQAVDSLLFTTPTDELNSGSPTSIVDALGMLEQFIGEAGAGRGLMHVSRYGAAWLANTRGVKSDADFHLWTAQGTPIVNGAGYSKGPTVVNSQFWVYATGPMHVFRSSDILYTEAPALGLNTKYGVAERFYSVGADCFVAAILVDPSLSPEEVGP